MKRTRRILTLLFLTAALLALPAFASTPGYSTGSVSYDTATGKFSASYQGAQAGKEYTLLVVEGTKTFYSIKPERIQYLDQKKADGSTVSFNFIPVSYVAGDKTKSCVVLLTWTGSTTPVMLGTLDGNANGAVVSGTVNYQTSSIPATVTLYDASGAQLDTVKTDASGAYSFYSVPNSSGYRIVVTKLGYCRYELSNITVSGDSKQVRTIDISRLAGDLNGNGTVNGYDLAALLKEFNNEGDAITLKAADINGNGAVNGYDLSALLSSFNNSSIAVTE